MTNSQRGVALGMGSAAVTGIVGLILAALYMPTGAGSTLALESRLGIAALAMIAPIIMLLACIARLAKHRFFTPDDIEGSGLTSGTDRAKLLQALLQNTLEQTALAVPVYFCAALAIPAANLGVVLIAGLMFLLGRLLFFAGYAKGAPSRAFGFALTFYPTVLLALTAIYFLLAQFFVS